MVVQVYVDGGAMLKKPPLSLSSRLQKTVGESNSGLRKHEDLDLERGLP